MDAIILALAIAFLAAIFYVFAKSFRRNYQRLSHPDNFAAEAEPLLSEAAKVTGKQTVMDTFRPDMITPNHRVRHLVSFEMEDGTQKTLEVDEASYHHFSVWQTGVLVTQNSHMLDFA